MGARSVRLLKRICLFLLLGLVVVEAGLQIGAILTPIVYSRGGRQPSREADVTILCVGDSHTFGAALPESESYPFQLQKVLSSRDDRDFEVVNLGIPGMNSAMVANRLPSQIARIRPDLVIAWAGMNSFWNSTETEAWDRGWSSRLRSALFRLKLIRLVAMNWYNLTGFENARAELVEKVEDEFVWRYGDETLSWSWQVERPSHERARRGIEQDLTRMIETARLFGVPILFVTYPYEVADFRTANDVIRAVAVKDGIDVIDGGAALRRAKDDGYTFDDLIVMAAGPHPRGLLNGYLVDLMVPEVLQLIGNAEDEGGRAAALRAAP